MTETHLLPTALVTGQVQPTVSSAQLRGLMPMPPVPLASPTMALPWLQESNISLLVPFGLSSER